MRTIHHIAAFLVLTLGAAAFSLAATPKEAVGFSGSATGTVKSAAPDGTSFVLTVTSATPDDKSTAKDGAAMKGKQIMLGVRMPRKDGKPGPHPDDIAWIKSLKVGDSVTVKIFAVKSDPSVLRITGPGEKADAGK